MPLPPNRTGGSLASGSPVSGCSIQRERLFGLCSHEHHPVPPGLPDSCAKTSDHSVSNHRWRDRGSPGCQRVFPRPDRLRLFPSRLAHVHRPNRVHLVPVSRDLVTDRSFSFRCSPPRLAATQLRFDTPRLLAVGKRTSIVLSSRPLRRTRARQSPARRGVAWPCPARTE